MSKPLSRNSQTDGECNFSTEESSGDDSSEDSLWSQDDFRTRSYYNDSEEYYEESSDDAFTSPDNDFYEYEESSDEEYSWSCNSHSKTRYNDYFEESDETSTESDNDLCNVPENGMLSQANHITASTEKEESGKGKKDMNRERVGVEGWETQATNKVSSIEGSLLGNECTPVDKGKSIILEKTNMKNEEGQGSLQSGNLKSILKKRKIEEKGVGELIKNFKKVRFLLP